MHFHTQGPVPLARVISVTCVSSRRLGINALLRVEPKKLCQVTEGGPGGGLERILVSMPRQPFRGGTLGNRRNRKNIELRNQCLMSYKCILLYNVSFHIRTSESDVRPFLSQHLHLCPWACVCPERTSITGMPAATRSSGWLYMLAIFNPPMPLFRLVRGDTQDYGV